MTNLSHRKSRLVFSTEDSIRDRGTYREVVIEARPRYAVIRLKGTRKAFTLTYQAMYEVAAKMEADRVRAEKREAAKAGKKARR